MHSQSCHCQETSHYVPAPGFPKGSFPSGKTYREKQSGQVAVTFLEQNLQKRRSPPFHSNPKRR